MSLLELIVNPNAGRSILPDCCNEETFAAVRAFHETLPGYAPLRWSLCPLWLRPWV